MFMLYIIYNELYSLIYYIAMDHIYICLYFSISDSYRSVKEYTPKLNRKN